jgi:hypothetical protein
MHPVQGPVVRRTPLATVKHFANHAVFAQTTAHNVSHMTTPSPSAHPLHAESNNLCTQTSFGHNDAQTGLNVATVQHTTIQQPVTQHSTTQHNTRLHNTAQHNTSLHNTAQHNTARHDTTPRIAEQHGTTPHIATQCNRAQHSKIRATATQHERDTNTHV